MNKRYIKDLEIENNMLIVCLLILTFIFIIWLCFAIKEKSDLKKENARLEQQIIDYRWQLEQVQYIMEYQKGE